MYYGKEMIIKFLRLKKDAIIPKYAHPGDAGMDLYSLEDKILKSKERYGFNTGLSIEIPDGFVGLIWEKSGLAVKEGLMVLGGVIDSGFRGEIGIILFNSSNKTIRIEKNQKIAQLLIQPIITAKIREVTKLSDTSRGEGRFGSTGKK
jgi:dUTP pyrophosphatase